MGWVNVNKDIEIIYNRNGDLVEHRGTQKYTYSTHTYIHIYIYVLYTSIHNMLAHKIINIY